MSDNTIRSGSLQFYPRKRVTRILPSVNWKAIPSPTLASGNKDHKGLMGFIGYKVGMTSVFAKDTTDDSMTKGKKIIVPATIVECPGLKIFSIRFYKDNIVQKEVLVSNDKQLKKRVKVPKTLKDSKHIDQVAKEIEYDDIRVIVYSEVGKTGIGKKNPDMLEIAISGGNKEEKLHFAKEKIGKTIAISEVFRAGKGQLLDVRGVTKAHGLQGPMKRFGIALRVAKSEKGRRRPGSLGPWHPARVTFRVPMAGQIGYFTRACFNNAILQIGSTKEKDINVKQGFHRYGNVNTDYIILRGSIPGPKKRVLVLTQALRPTKAQRKLNYEVIELR